MELRWSVLHVNAVNTTLGFSWIKRWKPREKRGKGWTKRSSKQILGKAWNSFQNYRLGFTRRSFQAELSLFFRSESARPTFPTNEWFDINAVTSSRLTNSHMGRSFMDLSRPEVEETLSRDRSFSLSHPLSLFLSFCHLSRTFPRSN